MIISACSASRFPADRAQWPCIELSEGSAFFFFIIGIMIFRMKKNKEKSPRNSFKELEEKPSGLKNNNTKTFLEMLMTSISSSRLH